ncbi:unnamed protein product [Diplocarpon coronariae]
MGKLPYKAKKAQAKSLAGIERVFEALEWRARDKSGRSTDEEPSPDAQLRAAGIVRKLCDERGLEVVGLQPILHSQRLDRPRGPVKHIRRLKKTMQWFKIARTLRMDIINIPASFSAKDKTAGDIDLVADILKAAHMEMNESPAIKFASENLR